MAISVPQAIEGQSSVDGTSFETAAFTPVAGRVLFACIENSSGTTAPDPPTVTGHSLTWDLIDASLGTWRFDDSGTTQGRISVYRALVTGSPGSATVTITFNVTATACAWIIFEADGVDTGGTNASNAVGSIVRSTTPNLTATDDPLTLAAAGNSDNRPFATYAGNCSSFIERTNWTEINDIGHSSPTHAIMAQWRSDQYETSVSVTSNNSSTIGGIAWEMVIAGGGGGGWPPGDNPAAPPLRLSRSNLRLG